MLLSILVGEPTNRNKIAPRTLCLKCDQCDCNFTYPYSLHKEKLQYHFCTRRCSQAARGKNGVLRPIMEETMRQKLGDDWATQIAQKAQSKLSPDQRKARGQKAKKTVLERYGANSATQIPHVREACMEARLQPEVIERQQATVMSRFGVKSVLSLPEVHALANTPEKCKQRHETMKQNGSYFNSQSEHAFHAYLVERFGEENVKRQVIVNTWPIDFYVKSVDTYVQFDGEYWHGLDRSLEEISQFKTPRDRTILRKYQIDREQEDWFAKNQMRLVRITDRQFEKGIIDL